MKHFKFWCIILAVFVTLSLIVLNNSKNGSRAIASTASLQAELEMLDQTKMSKEELETKTNSLLEQLETEVAEVIKSVDTIYTRGETIATESKTADKSDQLQANLAEINTLQANLDNDKETIQNLLLLINNAKAKSTLLENKIDGVDETLEILHKKLNTINIKIAQLEESKPVVIEQIEERLLLVQANEIKALKEKNCDMEETVCRQDDQITELSKKVEALIADKKKVTQQMNFQNLGPMGLFMQMQLNMMQMMMQSFALYNPIVTSTPFTQNRFGYGYGPIYSYDTNFFAYNPLTYFPVIQEEEKNEKVVEESSKELTDKMVKESSKELTDKMVKESIDKEFNQTTDYISRYTAPSETFYMF